MHHDPLNDARRTLRDYPFSRDYTALGTLLQTQAVLCLCTSGVNPPKQRPGTAYGILNHRGQEIFAFKTLNGTLFWSPDLHGFLFLCKQYHVEFLPPHTLATQASPEPSALAQFFMWIGVSITALTAVTILFIFLSSTSRT